MSKAQHTPGPWTWGKSYDGLYGSGSGQDNEVLTYEDYDGMWLAYVPQREANARLIAAAPELLEALENLENDDGSIPDHAWNLCQAAIAKAKGEA